MKQNLKQNSVYSLMCPTKGPPPGGHSILSKQAVNLYVASIFPTDKSQSPYLPPSCRGALAPDLLSAGGMEDGTPRSLDRDTCPACSLSALGSR